MAKAENPAPLVLAPKGADSTLRKHLVNVCETILIAMICKALGIKVPDPNNPEESSALKFRLHAIFKAGKPGSKAKASVTSIEATISERALTVWNFEVNGGASANEMVEAIIKGIAVLIWKSLYGKDGGNPQQQIKDRASRAVYSVIKQRPEFLENLKTLVKSAAAVKSKGASVLTFRFLGGEYAETSYRILKDDQKSYLGLLAFSILSESDLYVEVPKKGQFKVPEATSLAALKLLMESFVPDPTSVPFDLDSEVSDAEDSSDFTSEALEATA